MNWRGKDLRHWRETKGYTQDYTAKLLGVSYPTYKRWESEKLANYPIPKPIFIAISLMDKIDQL